MRLIKPLLSSLLILFLGCELSEGVFENPLDRMPIAKEDGTMHEKMYQIATAKYNPFAVGGSENIGGSENMLDK